MSRITGKTQARGGFTLVELLVVIGIIAILLSFLMPAISRIKEHANRTKCANNLREMGKALLMYTQAADWKGNYPRIAPWSGLFWNWWTSTDRLNEMGMTASSFGYLEDYCGGSRKLLLCPSRKTGGWTQDYTGKSGTQNGLRRDYVYYGQVQGQPLPPWVPSGIGEKAAGPAVGVRTPSPSTKQEYYVMEPDDIGNCVLMSDLVWRQSFNGAFLNGEVNHGQMVSGTDAFYDVWCNTVRADGSVLGRLVSSNDATIFMEHAYNGSVISTSVDWWNWYYR